MAVYHFSFCWTSVRLLTLWTTRFFCQCYPTVFLWTLRPWTGLSHLTDRTQLFTHHGSQTDHGYDCSVPHGSLFGPVGLLYTEHVVDLMDRHAVRSHMYADDTQFYDSCCSSDIDSLRARLSHCASDTGLWCRSRRLQLNANKTDAIWFGSKSNHSKLSTANTSV